MKRLTRRRTDRRQLDLPSRTFSLSRAKTYLGRLADKALRGEPVYIMRGRHRFILQHVPEIEPIPMRPEGFFAHCYTPAEVAEDNRLAAASVQHPPKDLE